MKKNRKIPFKRILLVLSFLLFIIVAIFYTTMKQNIIEASSTQTLLLIDKISQEKNNGLSIIFKDWYEETLVFSRNILNDEDEFDTDYINYLEKSFDSDITVFDTSGFLYTNVELPPELIDKFINNIIANQNIFINRTFHNNISVSVAFPIVNKDGTIVGGIVSSHLATDLQMMFFDNNQLTNMIIINSKNEIILDNNPSIKNSLLKSSESDFISNDIFNIDNNTLITINDKEYYITYTYNSVSHWLILTLIENDALLSYSKEVTSHMQITLLGSFAFTILMYIFILILYFTITRILNEKSELLSEKNKSLKEIADKDIMTGLLNKTNTISRINDLIDNYDGNGKYALLFVDIDDFKTINDTYGHKVGDELIINFSNILKNYFRNDDIIGRFGGDEFIIFIKNIKTFENIEDIANRLCNKIYEESNMHTDYNFSTSIGISLFPDHGSTYTSLVENADLALYESKNSGKNTYKIYDDKKVLASPMN